MIDPRRIPLRGALALTVTLAAGVAGALGATTTAAATTTVAGASPDGRVTSRTGVVVRSLPTTFSAGEGTVARGRVIPLACAVTGTVVFRNNDEDADSSNLWYRLPASDQWVSGLYVDPVGAAPPYCGDGRTYRARAVPRLLTAREAPTTRAAARGGFTQGTAITVRCKLAGQPVDGNRLWYNLDDGRWVAARHVTNVGAAPAYCTD